MNSIQSTALEPTRSEMKGLTTAQKIGRLLPALVGAFLGSTTIKPGRVNVWGTLVGVIILAVGISGIQQFGGSFWVEPLFNGVTLLVAIGIAGYAQRRRGAVQKAPPVSPNPTK